MTMIISGSDGLEFPDGSDQGTAFTGNAATITSGTIATARLGSGTADETTYLRGDQTWATVTQTRISGGTTGLTPSSLTGGDVTLAGTLAVANGGTGNTNGTAAGVSSGSWAVTISGTKIYFAYGGVNKASLDSSGNLVCVGNVTAYGTVS